MSGSKRTSPMEVLFAIDILDMVNHYPQLDEFQTTTGTFKSFIYLSLIQDYSSAASYLAFFIHRQLSIAKKVTVRK